MSNVIQVRRGETFSFNVEIDDPNAQSALFVAKQNDGDVIASLQDEVPFQNLVASFSFSTRDTMIEPGDYVYQVSVFYNNGTIEEIFPNNLSCTDTCTSAICTGECSLPKLTICQSLKVGIS